MKSLIRRLDKESFRKLVETCLNHEYEGEITALPEFGDDVWHRASYSYDSDVRLRKADAFYIIQHLPGDLFKNPLSIDFRQPEVVKMLNDIRACDSIEAVEYDAHVSEHLILRFMN